MSEEYNWIDFSEFISTVEKGDEIIIWSDGGCQPNPGPGGWGAILQKDNDRTVLTGGGPDTTNNRMEMIAALTSLDVLPHGCNVILHSDSQYVVKGISQWMWNWRRKGWKKNDGSDITNVDLWKDIHSIVRRHSVRTVWVKGHNGHTENEICDQLATESRLAVADAQRAHTYATAKFKSPLQTLPKTKRKPLQPKPRRSRRRVS